MAPPMRFNSPVARIVFLLCFAFLGLPLAGAAANPLLKLASSQDPVGAGWELRGGPTFDGGWIEEGNSAGHCLAVRRGYWQTPLLAAEPFHYYRIRFDSKTSRQAYWAAAFFDEKGQELVADVYDGIDASPNWQYSTFCFRAHALAKQLRIRFQPNGQPLFVRNILVEQVAASDVAAWADEVAAANPLLRYEAPATRCQRLPKTIRTLRQGGKLRIVMLGDSICNDTSNSLYETLLMRACPQANIDVVTSVRSGTGCQFYKDAPHVQEYVLRFSPDLVIIAGISHGYDAEAIRSVIRQIKKASPCEILVLTGAITPAEWYKQEYLKHVPLSEGLENVENFTARMRRMTDEENVELLDMRSAWDEYLLYSPRPCEWFRRDIIHGNSRGKQVVGRILFRYFEPRR
jgi:hypothetical protein